MNNTIKYVLPLFVIIVGCSYNNKNVNISNEKFNPLAERFVTKAKYFEKNNQIDSTEFYLYKAKTVQPKHPYILHKLGLLIFSKNNYLGTALIYLNESIWLTRDSTLKKKRFNDRGTIYYKMGEKDRAFNDWIKAKEYGIENLKKYGQQNLKTIKSNVPYYYSLKGHYSIQGLYDTKYPKNSFDKEGRFLKGQHIIFTQKPKKGRLFKLASNSTLHLSPLDSKISIKKLNDITFDLFIPHNYTESIISYNVSISLNRGYELITYHSNRFIRYPDTLKLYIKNMPVEN